MKRPLPLPLSSLAEVAKKRSEAAQSEAASAKPVFLTRPQREALALQRLEEERLHRQREREAQQAAMQEALKAASPSPPTSSSSSSLPPSRDRRERDPRRVPAVDSRDASASDVVLREREAALIKAQHLGHRLDAKTKAVERAQGSRYKFNFDWSSADDTSTDPYALYEKRHESALLYGRGFVGGVDRKEQRKRNAEVEQLATQLRGRLDKTEVKERKEVERERKAPVKEEGEEEEVKMKVEDEAKVAVKPHPRDDKESVVMQAQRHWSQKRLEEMEERDWRIFKEDFEIATRGNRVPHPLRSWKESGLPSLLLTTLEKVGYKEPSPIQRAAIPVGLVNRDVVGIAETGSGKTAAFLLPMLVYISNLPPITAVTAEAGPYALIMAPTRELAQQISVECTKLGSVLGIRNVSIVGGLGIEEQGSRLREGTEVVIGTPGRLIDCIEKRYLVLHQCNYVVLDEADRMIDMNFEPQIIKVMDSMPSTNLRPEQEEAEGDHPDGQDGSLSLPTSTSGQRYRQTIMFSATMPPKVIHLAKKYLRHAVEIAVGDRRGKASSNVEQRVEWVKGDAEKRRRLVELLQAEAPPVIIFCNLKRTCDLVQRAVGELGIRSVVLHGGKTQETREEALMEFKRGNIDVLIATDVMGRGIDVNDVRLVINYEMPNDIQKYTHRIGRTGRAGKKGAAASFVSDADVDILYDLKAMLKEAGQAIPAELHNHEAARVKPGSVGEQGGAKKGKILYAE